MDQTIAAFMAHAGVSDVGLIRRRHLLAYREKLVDLGRYATATVNKKVGFLSTLIGTALSAGWIETGVAGNLFLEVPEDEGRREPFDEAQLERVFADPTFTGSWRAPEAKAGGELQYWLPLIACAHGLVSSEILQLGPDTVVPHPEHPAITCFNVTIAGGRQVKSLARRRWMPVRRELLELGLLDLVEAARAEDRNSLWGAMEAHDGNVTRVSGNFSSHWAKFTRARLGGAGLSLYAFRHGFQDRLSKSGRSDEVKKALVGHADSGMTRHYGTKSRPRVVDIVALDEAIQGLDWPFMERLAADR